MKRKLTINRGEATDSFKVKFDATPSGFGATRASLLRLLRANDLVGWSHYEESGKLDRKAFSRMSCGSTQVFSHREYKEAHKSAVSILVDCSGSMGARMRLTASAVIQLVKVFDKANVSYRVFGFDSEHESDTQELPDGSLYIPEDVRFYAFKHWNETLQKAIPKLGAIENCAFRGNPDYQGLLLSIEDLAKRPEKRKVLFFLTDSGSVNVTHMRYLDEVATKLGITLIGVGIQADGVRKTYKHAVVINDLSEMASQSFTTMLNAIK
jgi:cobalamin biosynthesis protein CobT